jgi:hypothetical protein
MALLLSGELPASMGVLMVASLDLDLYGYANVGRRRRVTDHRRLETEANPRVLRS